MKQKIIITLLIILTITLTGCQNEYNPKTDTCTEYNFAYGYNEVSNRFYPVQTDECIEWHTATKCELNPEAEGCVCDEYETYDSLVVINSTPTKIDNDYWVLQAEFTTEYEYCIKSHEKTIYDYTCEELKRAVILDQDYCPSQDRFSELDKIIDGCKDWLDEEKVKKVFQEKRCET